MPEFNIDAFMANFKGGAKDYLFYFIPSFPNIGGATPDVERTTYLVRSTNTPEANIEVITNPYQGYEFKHAGPHRFAEQTVTFNTDKDANILDSFIGWSNFIHNIRTNEYQDTDAYMKTQTLQLLGNSGNVIKEYKLIGSWPSVVGSATLDYSSTDVLQFEVTFVYQYFTVTGLT